ncbi:hypothetical protein GCM10010123_38770 [Pilimelia anulata]|uniref:DUF4307 domain-containing protein n=1 Tax=Pilimelia anulata TaxID=53371 RepID=A0A8J3FC94_9ACTN|nr:DUF4307 domain-containing protein [Pilimelia anulata]GGK05144.1 hypothetical protein GCM10010123_38770 [Pilimelia anulata]
MTDTTAPNAAPAPVFPPGRYGRRRAPRGRAARVWVIAASLLVVAAAVLVGVRGYREFGDPAYQPTVLSYTDVTDTTITIHFRVHLPAGAGATCAVRARAHDGSVVGRAEVPVPPNEPVRSYVLATAGRPFIGEVLRCRPA